MISPSDLPNNFFDFIITNSNCDPVELIMRHESEELGFDIKFAALQILARKKTKSKLPIFLNNPHFLFPDSISAEQASDQRVADYHAKLIGTSKTVIDLTAGLGIDAMTIAKNGNKVIGLEIDSNKAAFILYNKNLLEIENMEVINTNSCSWLDSFSDSPDFFFIDPARRTDINNRTYSFKECVPDITHFYKNLLKRGSKVFIKASPLLDISAIMNELENIETIYIISVKGEAKEVLVKLNPDFKGSPNVKALDLNDNGIKWSFSLELPYSKKIDCYADSNEVAIGKYLYEPGAALMKLHAGGALCERFRGLKKISSNTELFISDNLFLDFPGRIIEISGVITKKDQKDLKGKGYSVAVRNYPLSAQTLKHQLGVVEDSGRFIYGFRVGKSEKPILIEGKKIERPK